MIEHFSAITKDIERGEGEETILDDAFVETMEELGSNYSDYAQQNWDEGTCAAGLKVMRQHIADRLDAMLGSAVRRELGVGVDAVRATNDMHVCSGCRPSKFSLHVTMDWVYCDQVCTTMALLVYDIKGWFVKLNALWILNNRSSWETNEGVFRIRALIAHDLKIKDSAMFRGTADTLIDEAVYNVNHLLRAPAAVKARGGIPMFPVDVMSEAFLTSSELGVSVDHTGDGVRRPTNPALSTNNPYRRPSSRLLVPPVGQEYGSLSVLRDDSSSETCNEFSQTFGGDNSDPLYAHWRLSTVSCRDLSGFRTKFNIEGIESHLWSKYPRHTAWLCAKTKVNRMVTERCVADFVTLNRIYTQDDHGYLFDEPRETFRHQTSALLRNEIAGAPDELDDRISVSFGIFNIVTHKMLLDLLLVIWFCFI